MTILRLGVGGGLMILGLFIPAAGVARLLVFLAAALVSGYPVLLNAGKNILRGEIFDEMLLMALAAAGAFVIGEYAEGTAVLLLFQVGELFQNYAVDRSRDSIAKLMDIRPEEALLEEEGKISSVKPEDVPVDGVILVRPGDRVPLDGVVISGQSMLDTAALTGESLPRPAGPGDAVLSGSINQQAALRIRVTHSYQQSTVSRILTLTEEAGERKARLDRFITRFARVYTPLAVLAAALIALIPPLFFQGEWQAWLHSALTFLVISCPCALVISVPLTFFGGIGAASRRGILIKGAHFLEALARVERAAFDKTGTLTQGRFTLEAVRPEGMEEKELLFLAAAAERTSTHPIAQSLAEAWEGELPLPEEAKEFPGCGVMARVNGHSVAAGNGRLMEQAGVLAPIRDLPGAAVHVAVDGVYRGVILLADQLKAGAGEAVARIKALGVREVAMFTGDSASSARKAAEAAGIDRVEAGLLPHEKVERLEEMMNVPDRKGAVLFVGDGVNDAPVLARADVGAAMGALGSHAAMEAADIVIMQDDPGKLAEGILIARRTLSIARQNAAFALGVKAAVMAASLFTQLPLWAAVFADVGVCMLTVFNAMRALTCGKFTKKYGF
ncbi:MAG: cadmium-translocating P-type ATPase [Clostridiales bacterium]|nr:cadmium-translocating P-type ATPase [Clostridiales bacterium]